MNNNNKRSHPNDNMGEECVHVNLLFRFFEGAVSRSEANRVKKHLGSCDACFQVIASMFGDSTPLENEELEVAKILRLSRSEQVAKIIEYVEFDKNVRDVKICGKIVAIWNDFVRMAESLKERWNKKMMTAIPAVAILLILLVPLCRQVDIEEHYLGLYDNAPPYNIFQSEIWSDRYSVPINRDAGTQNIEAWRNALMTSMLLSAPDYDKRNYGAVINNLQDLQEAFVRKLLEEVETLPSGGSRQDSLSIIVTRQTIQEYYFYLGVNHLAYSIQSAGNDKIDDRIGHVEKAGNLLRLAEDLSLRFDIETGGRESLFLEKTSKITGADKK